jgi:asparagine synthase (glutamine-hydrolysing)
MCGIAGIYAWAEHAQPVDDRELSLLHNAMEHRGPDGHGIWIDRDRRIGLAHRRLAIIDVSDAGLQPMASADGRLQISFNGEIYNYRELRRELENQGSRFVSASDTEVLLALYAARGPKMLQALRGMFAFAIWDDKAQSLFIARDPYGIKPFYYHNTLGTFRFASEVGALLTSPAIERRIDNAARASFFLYGHVAEPHTIIEGVACLPAGSHMTVTRNGPQSAQTYASIDQVWREAAALPPSTQSRDTRARLAAEAVTRSIAYHFVSDVPVSVFLSAGIDSSMIVAAASRPGGPQLRTFTLGFDMTASDASDEVDEAEEFAKRYGTDHTTVRITSNDFDTCFSHLIAHMDQPTIDGVNSYFVSKAVRDHGLKVALSGVGGDELMMSYSTFRDLPRLAGMLAPLGAYPSIGRTFRRASASLIPRHMSSKFAGLIEYGSDLGSAYLLRRCLYAPWELPDLLGEESANAGLAQLAPLTHLRTATHQVNDAKMAVGALEASFYMRNQLLRDADWASMAHSVELRTPLVDWQLLRDIAPLLNGPNAPSRTDIARHMSRPIGEDVLTRKKSGFAPPVRGWMAQRLAREQHTGAPIERGLRSWSKLLFNAYCQRIGVTSGL